MKKLNEDFCEGLRQRRVCIYFNRSVHTKEDLNRVIQHCFPGSRESSAQNTYYYKTIRGETWTCGREKGKIPVSIMPCDLSMFFTEEEEKQELKNSLLIF